MEMEKVKICDECEKQITNGRICDICETDLCDACAKTFYWGLLIGIDRKAVIPIYSCEKCRNNVSRLRLPVDRVEIQNSISDSFKKELITLIKSLQLLGKIEDHDDKDDYGVEEVKPLSFPYPKPYVSPFKPYPSPYKKSPFKKFYLQKQQKQSSKKIKELLK